MMTDREFCRELLSNRERRELPKGNQIRVILLGLFSIPMLASGNPEVIPFGTLFLGLAVGSYVTSLNWKKRAQTNWAYIVKFLNWEKIEATSKDDSEFKEGDEDTETGSDAKSKDP